MKKVIIVEILLAFAVSMLLYYAIGGFVTVNYYAHLIRDPYYAADSDFYTHLTHKQLATCIPALLSALGTLAAMVLIAIKDFPCFKPLLDKLHDRREAKAVAKAEKAEADKQARIEQLQAELDELKKDE